ncbi:MAG: SPFH domain-containing protein [Desulfobacter postgatei]|uniref:SPFH domain-containing protein n=1 Tax=Desulfobacter postgatei TaxID=2293 RepID=UPI0023F3F763|nr:SPFH domain-containing protein [Desulfobacter postgatei]MDD4273430.1 SPFH domain-containing protein [Desulfobacter postgatei]
MGTNNLIYLEVLEWFDETGQELVHRLPEKGSGEIKFGAQLIVRESQAAVFFYQGKAVGAFGPGRHTLKTANIPILTKIASLPWAMESPLKAEVFFANLKTFTNLKWGTRDPVAFKDKDLGLVRLRAFGVFNLKIVQPVLFINTLAGTQGIYTSADISDYLNQVVVSRFNDYIGEKVSSIFDLPKHYDELGKALALRLREDFSAFGLNLTHLYINAITPPPEVQQAIDDKSRLGLFDDMNKLMQMKTAMAMEKIAENPQGIASDGAQAGLGLGLGMMLPGIFSQQMLSPTGQPTTHTALTTACPECQNQIPLDAKFCPQCGHQQVIFARCQYCGKNITPDTKFCPRCGKQVAEKTTEKTCGNCGAKNLPDSIFCNQCGEKY